MTFTQIITLFFIFIISATLTMAILYLITMFINEHKNKGTGVKEFNKHNSYEVRKREQEKLKEQERLKVEKLHQRTSSATLNITKDNEPLDDEEESSKESSDKI